MALARRAPSPGGTLIAFACLAAGKVDPSAHPPGLPMLAALLEGARDELAARGKVAPGDRTMLDALAPAVAAVRSAADAGGSVAAARAGGGAGGRAAPGRAAGAAAAAAGAAATAGMAATTGRAGWLADRARGHEDAGA